MISNVDDGSRSPQAAADGKPARGARIEAWDERLKRLTSGARLGTSGGTALLAFPIVALVGTINAFTILHDAARRGVEVEAWGPFALEYTSGVGIIVGFLLIASVYRRAPPRPPWARFALVHLAGSVVFSAAHVIAMVLLRHAIWAAQGQTYSFDFAQDWLYEYRKDVLAYGILAGISWVLARREPGETVAAPDEATVVFRDGARLVRFASAAITAAEASGNYVELLLSDGRRPLVRTTLAAAAAALEPHGFVRTHRSWLVRADRVRAIEPTGSGDHVLRLDGGLSAPLSRRFPEALRVLRTRAG